MQRGAGCLFLLTLIGLLSLELWLFLVVVQWAEDIVAPLVVIVVAGFLGVRLAIHHAKKLPLEFLSGGAGKRLVAIFGAIGLAFPGFGSDAIGLVLLFPPVQLLLARSGNVIAGSLIRNAMSRMGGKAGPGFPGGFPGGPFPGMQPRMRPDDSVAAPKKIIDTTVERDD